MLREFCELASTRWLSARPKIEIQRSQANSLKVVALQWHDWWASDKNPEYAEDVKIRLTRDIFPLIGRLPIDKIVAAQIVAAVRKIENRGAREVAIRALGNVGQVFRYAVRAPTRRP